MARSSDHWPRSSPSRARTLPYQSVPCVGPRSSKTFDNDVVFSVLVHDVDVPPVCRHTSYDVAPVTFDHENVTESAVDVADGFPTRSNA